MHSVFVFSLVIVFSLAAYVPAFSRITQSRSPKLSVAEVALVQGSRNAIMSTGISAGYFNAHFKLDRVVNKVGDRRVVWRFSVGEYRAILEDAVGFYTDEKGNRFNSHSVLNVLSTSHDIKSTIPRKRARQLMSQCLGEYKTGPVILQSFGPKQTARLLFTASSLPKFLKEGMDTNKPLIYTGFLDLETGECTKGIAQAGRPRALGH